MSKSILSVLFVNSSDNKRVLDKKPSKEDRAKALDGFLGQYFHIFCALAIVFMLVLFVVFMFWIVGISAVESGAMRNFLARGV